MSKYVYPGREGDGLRRASAPVDVASVPAESKPSSVMVLEEVLARCKVDHPSKVTRLNMWGIGFTDISVVRSFTNLEVASLSMNRISKLKPLSNCSHLTELYLRKNELEMSELIYLSRFPRLQILWLSDNPCALHSCYRTMCIVWCKNLRMLDQIPVSAEERTEAERRAETDPQCRQLQELADNIREREEGVRFSLGGRKLLPSDEVKARRERKSADDDILTAAPLPPDESELEFRMSRLQTTYVDSVLAMLPVLDQKSLQAIQAAIEKRLR